MQGKCGLFFTSYAQEDQIFQSRFQKGCLFLFLVALASTAPFLNSYHVTILTLINIAIIGAVSLNLLTGFCGQISLGHGAFIGVGAFTTALLARAGMPFMLALLGGGTMTALIGMIFGVPSLRLKGIYLAISTLAAQLILEYVFLHSEGLTGGANGLSVPPAAFMGFVFDTDLRMFYLTLVLAGLFTVLVANVVRTKPGRAFVAIRDFYLSAENVGINLFTSKLQAFAASSFLAGVVGGLWAYYTQYVTPEQFGIGLSISYLAMIVIGGLGSVQGSVFGAVFITILPEILTHVAGQARDFFPEVGTHILALKEGIFGLVLVLFLIFEPEGLVHRWRLVKAYWKLYPFAH